ncbi:GATA-type zinc finger protein 1 isoform 1-T3 [Menidia menidia]
MSVGPKTDAVFIQDNNKVEQDDSPSALFFLFQEVSKLASPIGNTCLNSNPSAQLLYEAATDNNFMNKKEAVDEPSFQTFYNSCQQKLPHMLPCNRMKTIGDDICNSKATVLDQTRTCNSPLKVLSLINLHCEKLLHQNVDDFGSGLLQLGRSTSATVAAGPDGKDGGAGGAKEGAEWALRPCLCLCERREQETTASVSPVGCVRASCAGDGERLQGCVNGADGGCGVCPHAGDSLRSVQAKLLEELEKTCLHPQNVHREEVKFSAKKTKWSQECMEDCSSSNKDAMSWPPLENSLYQTHTDNACPNSQLTVSSDGEGKKVLKLDQNANISLFTDTQQAPLSTVLLSSPSTSLAATLSKDDNAFTASQTPPRVAQLKSSSCDGSSGASGPDVSVATKEESDPLCARKWKTKTPRKQPHPSRSADVQDPDFQGVTFRMDTEVDDTKEQCRLLITSKYSKEISKRVRKPRPRTRMLQRSLKPSSSDEENELTTNVKGKVCASCCTRKTPMWRDAEDGTPLCNACGIRYKKYRVRCVSCWHIPRKESNSNSCCLKCGNFVRLTSAQRKYTT